MSGSALAWLAVAALAASLGFGSSALFIVSLRYWRDRVVNAGGALVLSSGIVLVGIPLYGDVTLEALGVKLHMGDRLKAQLIRDPEATAAMLEDVLATTAVSTPAVAEAVARRGIIVGSANPDAVLASVDRLAARESEACAKGGADCEALRGQLRAVTSGIVMKAPADVIKYAIERNPQLERRLEPLGPSIERSPG